MADDVSAQWKIALDHPVRPASRWGHGRPSHPELAELIAAGRGRYKSILENCVTWSQAFDAISVRHTNDSEPYWGCGWMSRWI